jgi:hypothetical protein
MYLVQELLTLNAMGVLQSNPVSNLITATGVLVNPLLGFGLWNVRVRARRFAIVWHALSSSLAVGVTYWMWRYSAAIDLAEWPDYVVAKVMPLFLLFVMLLPRTRRLFSSGLRTEPPGKFAELAENAPGVVPGVWPVLSLMVLMFLIVVCSTLLVDSADWIDRTVNQRELRSSDS